MVHGKSTLAQIIMGIKKQDSGEIIYNGVDISNMKINERANLGISFAFQQPVRFKGITVRDLMNLANKKLSKKRDICEYLSLVGLCAEEYLNREVNNSLSGGELKRIEIATILARNSSLAVFDEPEAGIDLWSFNNLIEVFEDIKKDMSILLISHQERILDIADQIILLNKGKVEKVINRGEALNEIYTKAKCCKVK